MKCELIEKLIPIVYALIGALIGGVIQILTTYLHNRNEKRIKRIQNKTKPYQGLYFALMDYRNYFLLFIEGGNEFKDSEEPEKFGPLETNMKFRKEYDKYRLFLSRDLRRKVDELQTKGEALNNLGIVLAMPTYQDGDLVAVEIECKEVIGLVDACVDQIQKELDLDK